MSGENFPRLWMSDRDFSLLAGDRFAWDELFTSPLDFENFSEGAETSDAPRRAWKWAHVFDAYSDVILARSFLMAQSATFETLWDMRHEHWLVLTDYDDEVKND